MRFKEVFKGLNGREATTEDVLQFERLTNVLETTSGDAMLAVFVALDHYITLYEKIPAKIRKEATDALISFKISTDAQAAASLAEAKAELAKAVSEVAVKVAHNTSAKQRFQWAFGCIAVAFLSLSLVGWYAHSSGDDSGYKAGYGAGYIEAKDEKAAASWANTPQGRSAYRLAQFNLLDSFLMCDKPGWSVEKGFCYVKVTEDGKIHGWKLP